MIKTQTSTVDIVLFCFPSFSLASQGFSRLFLDLSIYTVGLNNNQIFTSIWRSLSKIIEEGNATLRVLKGGVS
jgi:hypothetical protein